LAVSGMTCGNCARHVTEAIRNVPGVAHAAVALETHRATVKWAENQPVDVEEVLRALQDAGYPAKPLSDDSHDHHHDGAANQVWGVNVLTGIIPTVLLMVGEWVFGWNTRPWFRWSAFVLAAIVQFGPGLHFYRGGWRQLKAGASNMDTLVALGSTTAFAYSACVLFTGQPGHLYFMEAAAIITLVSIGHWMEARASSQASGALRSLLRLAPENARRLEPDGTERDIGAGDLNAGDRIVLRAGDRIPADGEVLEGASAVDESMLTGESLPAEKKPGEKLYAGTINLDGHLRARVTGTGEHTALARIIEAVERAQSSRANIQRLGDRISSVFVPVVVLGALGAGLWWAFAPEQARAAHDWLAPFLWHSHPPVGVLAAAFIIPAAVLIIACPCAMGLATPAAIMAGTNAAAKRGILIRDAIALEKAGEITAVVFDKTGTLTEGKPEVVHFDGFVPEVKALAASLARSSTHPLSRAVAKLTENHLEIANVKEVRGAGITAEYGGKSVRLGSLRWLELNSPAAEKWMAQGATVLGLSLDGKLAGLVALRDTLKRGAADMMNHLHRQGLKTFLVTGDNARTAAEIARQAGISPEHVRSEVRPENKADFIRELQQRERVAFVGDGINDAPALEQAHLGIAVGKASDIARESADMVLLRSDIDAIPESLGLARATLRTIKQNLFWAFVYNAVGIPLAALGFMSPVLCAAAMGLSDLVVIGNALRLSRWKP
jgi:P-type Cu+ transporter